MSWCCCRASVRCLSPTMLRLLSSNPDVAGSGDRSWTEPWVYKAALDLCADAAPGPRCRLAFSSSPRSAMSATGAGTKCRSGACAEQMAAGE